MLKKISVVCAKATDQHVARSRDILTNFLDQVSHPETRMTIKRTISERRQRINNSLCRFPCFTNFNIKFVDKERFV